MKFENIAKGNSKECQVGAVCNEKCTINNKKVTAMETYKIFSEKKS
jgi:hypothetical protein